MFAASARQFGVGVQRRQAICPARAAVVEDVGRGVEREVGVETASGHDAGGPGHTRERTATGAAEVAGLAGPRQGVVIDLRLPLKPRQARRLQEALPL